MAGLPKCGRSTQQGGVYAEHASSEYHRAPLVPKLQSDVGVLLKSSDGGDSWTRVDMGLQPAHTMFALAFDERQPSRMSCATNGGEVYCTSRKKRCPAAGNLGRRMCRLLCL